MRQLLTCPRCGRAEFVDLAMPVDLCGRCLRSLGFDPGRLTEADLAALDNAAFLVDVKRLTWEEAVKRSKGHRPSARREVSRA